MSANRHPPHPRAPTDAVSCSTAPTNRRQVFHSSSHHVSPTYPMCTYACSLSLTRSLPQVISEQSSKRSSKIRSSSINRRTSQLHVRRPIPHSTNLTHGFLRQSAIVESTFDPPEGQAPYSYVFDLSGEIRWDRPEQVRICAAINLVKC